MGIFNKPPLRLNRSRDDMPEGLWTKCPDCGAMLHQLELKQHQQTCHHCGHHFLMDSRERITLLADPGSFTETEIGLISANPLGFQQYRSGYAAAVAWVLFILIMIVSVVQLRIFRYRDVD